MKKASANYNKILLSYSYRVQKYTRRECGFFYYVSAFFNGRHKFAVPCIPSTGTHRDYRYRYMILDQRTGTVLRTQLHIQDFYSVPVPVAI
jgi:hypothetical protein